MILDERLSTYIDFLSWNIPEYLQEVEKQALLDKVPIIRRSMQSLLAFLLQARKVEAILEIGAAVGFSSMLMSEYADAGVTIDTIEKVPGRIQAARENYRRYGKEGQIHLIEGDAAEILQELVEQGKRYDFIFMDAAKGQYPNFLHAVLTLLAENGMLVTDNVLQDGDIIESRYAITRRDRTIHGRMREFLYTLTHSADLQTVILPVGDGTALTIYKKKAAPEKQSQHGG